MQLELPESLKSWLDARKASDVHRQLIVIDGQENWGIESAEKILAHLTCNQILWSGERKQAGNVRHQQYRQYLGMEFDAVVYNAHSGVRANAMMSLSGTVKSKGLMLLLCPELSDWPAAPDPEKLKRTSYGFEQEKSHSLFIEWLITCIEADVSVARLNQKTFIGQQSTIDNKTQTQFDVHQSDAVEAIVNLQERPLVITADRGRGKSSTLGLAAARLMIQRRINIVVTAPAPRAVTKVFEHASQSLSNAIISKNLITYEKSKLKYMAIDMLLASLPAADLLLIDEAAAIPNEQLKKLQRHYPKIVFSTTVHGYEGSGRGFEIRFRQYLDGLEKGWQSLHLNLPMRWSWGDSLERFWFDAMLMNDKYTYVRPEIENESVFGCYTLTQRELKNSPALLSQVFQLMVNAHYQTVPDDLVRLLDAPDQRIFIARKGDLVVGVMLLNIEGGEVLKDISEDISAGLRRPSGHLVAQNLAYSMANSAIAIATYLRVTRIAVTKNQQRQGIASNLISSAAEYARNNNVNFLSTSFGLNSPLLRFWEENNFTPVKLGTRKDASSGEYSLMMLHALDEQTQPLLELTRNEFQKELSYQLKVKKFELQPELVQKLTHKALEISQSPQLMTVLRLFCNGSRPLDSCERLIHEYIEKMSPQTDSKLLDAYQFLHQRVTLGKRINWLSQHYRLTGKKQVVARARECLSLLMAEDKR